MYQIKIVYPNENSPTIADTSGTYQCNAILTNLEPGEADNDAIITMKMTWELSGVETIS